MSEKVRPRSRTRIFLRKEGRREKRVIQPGAILSAHRVLYHALSFRASENATQFLGIIGGSIKSRRSAKRETNQSVADENWEPRPLEIAPRVRRASIPGTKFRVALPSLSSSLFLASALQSLVYENARAHY